MVTNKARLGSRESHGGKRWLKGLADALLAIMVVLYSLLSYYPPRSFLIEHPDTGEYGILESYEGHDHEEDHVD